MNNSDLKDSENIRITENDLPQEFILKLLGRYEAKGLWGIKHTREPVDAMVKYAKTHELSLPIVQLVVTREGLFMTPIQCRLDSQTRECELIKKMQSRHQSDRRIYSPKSSPEETWNEGPVRPRVKTCNIGQSMLKLVKENYIDCENRRAANNAQCQKMPEETQIPNKGKFIFSGNKTEKTKVAGPVTDLQLLDAYSRLDWKKSGVFFFGIDTISYGVQDLIYTRVFSMIVINDRRKKNWVPGSSPFMCHAFVCESRSTAKKVTYALAAAFQAYGRSMKTLVEPTKQQKPAPEEKPKKFVIELRPAREVACNDSEA